MGVSARRRAHPAPGTQAQFAALMTPGLPPVRNVPSGSEASMTDELAAMIALAKRLLASGTAGTLSTLFSAQGSTYRSLGR